MDDVAPQPEPVGTLADDVARVAGRMARQGRHLEAGRRLGRALAQPGDPVAIRRQRSLGDREERLGLVGRLGLDSLVEPKRGLGVGDNDLRVGVDRLAVADEPASVVDMEVGEDHRVNRVGRQARRG